MLPTGTRVGRYRIESLLGAGGMGEVYDAVDTSLGRRVALKLLPPDLAADPARVERFLREAEAASALDHPSIVTVYDAGSAAVEDGGEVSFLAMERLDGEPLAAWMRRSRDLARGLELMADVADGLARAHARGIVHRDLKPENIVVARGGYAKIVDFGVAKLTERAPSGNGHGDTAPSSIIGTAAYMSPEQVEGRPVDGRSDVFSFGCVLYELVTGRSPFAAERRVDTLHNVVHLAPPPAEGAPPELQRILRKCLAKDPDERYHSIKDAALDLREVAREIVLETKDVRQRRRASLKRAIVPIALLVVVAAGALWQIRQARLAAPAELRQPIMSRVTNSGRVGSAAISPDGRYAAYTTMEGDLQSIWIKQIATGASARVLQPVPHYLFKLHFSPDGNYLYYSTATRAEPNVNDIQQLSVLGGEPRRVAHDVEIDFGVSPDGRQLAVRRFSAVTRENAVSLVDVDAGTETPLFQRRFPIAMGDLAWSPDGQSIAYFAADLRSKPKIACFAIDLATRQERLLFTLPWTNLGGLLWLPDGSGFIINAYDRLQPPQIWLVPLRGEPRKITSDVSAYGSPSITADGKSLALIRTEGSANIWRVDLDAPRTPQPLTTGLGNVFGGGGVRALADGRVIFTNIANGKPSLYMVGPGGGEPQPLVRDGSAWMPEIAPDGRHMAFISERSGTQEVWYSEIDGRDARQVTRQSRAGHPSFLPDGKSLVFISNGAVQAAWRVNLDGTGLQRITDGPANSSAVSPDGKFLFCRLRSRDANAPLWRTAIIPMAGGAPRFYDVPRFGGPPVFRWRADSKALAFIDFQGGVANIWLQEVEGGEPKQLTFFDAGRIYTFDWSKDGKSLVFSGGEPATDVVVIRDFR